MAKSKGKKKKSQSIRYMRRLSDRNVVVFIAIFVSAGLLLASVLPMFGGLFSQGGGYQTPVNDIANLEQALKESPDDVYLIDQLGIAYFNSGNSKMATDQTAAAADWQKAVEMFQKVVEKQPDNVQAYGEMATAYFYLGQTDKAIEEVQKALDIDPQFGPARLNYATYVASTGDYVKAIQILQAMEKTNANYEQAQAMIKDYEKLITESK